MADNIQEQLSRYYVAKHHTNCYTMSQRHELTRSSTKSLFGDVSLNDRSWRSRNKEICIDYRVESLQVFNVALSFSNS